MPESESTNRVEMVTHTHTQRATAWLCLAVAVLIALMPAAGVMVCLGHNGHVGIGVPTKTSSCPCEHHSATEDEPSADLAENEDRHPPCSAIAPILPKVRPRQKKEIAIKIIKPSRVGSV